MLAPVAVGIQAMLYKALIAYIKPLAVIGTAYTVIRTLNFPRELTAAICTM
jgi:hypothetical protein